MERAGREVRERGGERAAPERTPPVTTADHLLALQRTAGNAAVARMIARNVTPPPPTVEVPGIVVCFGGTVEPILDMEHHWIEIGEESYGWWPSRMRDGDENLILGWTGVPGVLNGTTLDTALGRRGSPTRDPHHGDAARRYGVTGLQSTYGDPATATQTAAAAIREFAQGFTANYSWNPLGTDCHEFVQRALAAASLRRGAPVAEPAAA